MHYGDKLVQIEIPNRPSRIRSFLGLLDRFLKLLLQQVGSMLLGLHRLAEDGIAAAVLLFASLIARLGVPRTVDLA